MHDQYMEIYTKLSRLQWLLQRQHMQSHTGHGPTADPTRGQGRVLAMLKLQPEISTKDLSYLLGIRQQSLNELLGKLEKGGYVTRVPSETDRRVMVVKLTEKGRVERQPQADFSNVFDCLTSEEQTTFGGYLDRVIAALEAQLSDEERQEIEQWMRKARSRMGGDKFERMMAMWAGGRAHHGDPRFHGGWRGDHHGPHGRDGFPGCGGDCKNEGAPADGADGEDFEIFYDAPMPHGFGRHDHVHGRRPGDRPCPPPPPPSGPHDPDEE